MYEWMYKHFLSRMDPESAHKMAVKAMSGFAGKMMLPKCKVKNSHCLKVRTLGKLFSGPLGMAAGFDKYGVVAPALWRMGFGHVEVGTVTVDPREGNKKPRIWREKNCGLRNYMGLPGPGMAEVCKNLKSIKYKNGIIGASINSIGNNRFSFSSNYEPDRVLHLMAKLYGCVDYFTINASCPNVSHTKDLEKVLRTAMEFKSGWGNKPVLLKIAPYTDDSSIIKMADLAQEYKLSGIVAVNTIPHPNPRKRGGRSGPCLKRYGLKAVKTIFRHTDGKLPIIGVGGISNAEDVLTYVKCGAHLVQLYTSFIYRGPKLPTVILSDLLEDSKKHGWNSLKDIRGVWS